MNSFLIIFSVIVLANANPIDFDEPYDDDDDKIVAIPAENVVIKSDIDGKIPIGVFTKYPDDPNEDDDTTEIDELPLDETRFKRNAEYNETDPSIDVSKQTSNSVDVNRSQRKSEDQPKVPLRGLITAIESDLISTASQVNSNLRTRRAIPQTVDEGSNTENASTSDDSVDVNKDFFEGLFNFTRPLRETEDKNLKIPLDGLVQAVEATLVNSAQTLKDAKHSKRDTLEKTSIASTEASQTNRNAIDILDSDKETIKVQKLTSSNIIQNLNLLNPITFKSVPTVPVTEHSSCDDETISTTELPPIQKTNITVLESSNSVNLVPGIDNKLAHLQHQEISKTVFFSSLAIFPTIPPKSINAPLPYITTTEEPVETTVAIQASISPSKIQQDAKHEQLLQKAQKLKEKFAEIQADPVILSQF